MEENLNYIKSDSVNEIYYTLAKRLKEHGNHVNGTHELENVTIVLTNPKNNVITLRERKTALRYLLAENIWYAAGSNKLEFIDPFASTWRRITDDGVTCNSAYGYIMKYKFGFNQIEKVIEMLKKNQYQRRAVININYANEDIIETKDEQCTMFLQFLLRDGKLNMTACMRSNDLIYGFTNDIVAFTTIQMYIADRLGVEVGTYTHFDVSLHYYDNAEEGINRVLNSTVNDIKPLEYEVNWPMIYDKADKLYMDVLFNQKDIIKICEKNGIIYRIENKE